MHSDHLNPAKNNKKRRFSSHAGSIFELSTNYNSTQPKIGTMELDDSTTAKQNIGDVIDDRSRDSDQDSREGNSFAYNSQNHVKGLDFSGISSQKDTSIIDGRGLSFHEESGGKNTSGTIQKHA